MKSSSIKPNFISYALDTNFMYDTNRKMYIGNKRKFNNFNFFQELYKGDKITVGFAIRKSDQPGNPRQTFYLIKTKKNEDGIDYWLFKSIDNSNTYAKIIND